MPKSPLETQPSSENERPALRKPEEYERLLNPEQTLPKIDLQLTAEEDVEGESPEEKQKFLYFNVCTPGSEEPVITLSVVVLVPYDEAYVYDIGVTETDNRDKGYGKAAYLAVLTYLAEKQLRFRSGISLSKSAWKIWEWMKEKGAARLVNDRGVREDNEDFYSYSDYEIV